MEVTKAVINTSDKLIIPRNPVFSQKVFAVMGILDSIYSLKHHHQ